MTALRRIDLDARNAILALPKEEGDGINAANAQAAIDIMEAARRAKEAMAKAMPANDGLKDMADKMAILQRAAQSFATSMSSAFGSFGQAIGGVTSAITNLGQKQLEIAQRLKQGMLEARGDTEKMGIATKQAADESAIAQVSAFGDMAGAAKGFFKEHSKGYEAMQKAEQVFRLFEMAKSAEVMGAKLMEILGISVARTAATGTAIAEDVAYTGVSLANSGLRATADGTAAVAKTAASVPFPYNIAAVAAVVALLAGFGVMLSGGGGTANTDAADRQAAQGTGSVFGDSKAKSESIINSMEIVAKYAELDYGISNDMLSSLRSISASMGNFVNLLLRNVGGALTGQNNGYEGLGLNLGSSSGFLGFNKTSTNVTDSGIMGNSGQTVGGVVAGGFHGQSYVDTQTTSSSFWGLVKKTSNNTRADALPADIEAQFTQIIVALRSTVLSAVKIFGDAGSDFASVLDALAIDFGKISFKGMTGQEITEAVNAIFSKLGDEMATAVLPGLMDFARVGEGTFETLTRLATDYKTVDLIFARMGQTFGEVGWKSMAAREQLIDFAGGIDELTKKTDFYFTHFYSEGEQLAAKTSRIADEFARLGVTGVSTLSQFRQMMDTIKNSADFTALSPAGDAARMLYTQLLALAPAFYDVSSAVSSAIDSIQNTIADLYGGSYGAAFAHQALVAAANAVNAATGSSYTAEQTIADLQSGVNTQYILDYINSANADPVMIGLLQTLLTTFQTWTDAVNNNTNSTDNNTTATNNDAAQQAARLASERRNVASYLQGSILSASSPLLPAQKYAEAMQQYNANLIKAQRNDAQAIADFSKYREAMLQASANYNQMGSGQYNADWFTSYNAGAGLTAGEVGPYTYAQATQNTQMIVDSVQAMQVELKAVMVSVANTTAQLASVVKNGSLQVQDPDLVDAVETLAGNSQAAAVGSLP